MTVPLELLESFLSAETSAAKLAAIRAMTVDKSLTRATKDERFARGLNELSVRAASQVPEEAWLSLAGLGLIASVAKKTEPDVSRIVRDRLSQEPPPMPSLSADDRYYGVMAVCYASGDWASRWAAQLAVNEESAKNIRGMAVGLLIRSTGNMSAAMLALGAAFAGLAVETDDPSATVGRRLRRVCEAIQAEWAQSGTDPGEQPGRSLTSLVEQTFRRHGTPKIGPLREELARRIAALVHEAIRARFSHSVKSTTYEPIELIASWFRDGSWDDVISKSPEFTKVELDITEALRILVQSGLTDNRMLKSLALVAGPARTAEIRKTLAQDLAGAPEASVAWIRGGDTSSRPSASLEESGFRAIDSLLANLLLHLEILRGDSAQIRSNVAPVVAAASVRDENLLLDFLDRTSDAMRAFTAICTERQLRLFGRRGDVVEFRPSLHEPVGGANVGSRHAKVIEPGVEAGSQDAGVRIVRRALVELCD